MRRLLRSSVVLACLAWARLGHAEPYFAEATGALFPAPRCGQGDAAGCYTSALVVADLDGDGRMDVVFANGGGYYVSGAAEPAVVLFNEGPGQPFSDGTETSFLNLTSRVRQVAVGDLDGDGDLDVILPGGYGLDDDRVLIQTAPRVFEDQSAARLPAAQKSRAGAAHLGDLDGDGDLDLVMSDWGTKPLSSPGAVKLWLNDGQGVFAPVEGRLPPALKASVGNTPIDLDLQDVDGDFDLDLLVNHRNGQSRLLVNGGQATFVEAPFPPKQGPYTYNTEACDIDGDGDLDLLLDNAAADLGAGHRTQILINDGAGVFTDESAVRVAGEPNTDDNIVKCADLDDDGDLDLLIGSLQSPAEKVLRNDGQGVFQTEPGAFPATNDPTLGLDVADLDGDGRLDVVTGQGEGQPRRDRVFLGAGLSQVDTHPPVFRRVEAPAVDAAQAVVLRMAVSDAFTSEVGQHVASVRVAYDDGTSAGEVTARFVGGDLFRAKVGMFPVGTTLTLTPRATDRGGRTTEGEPVVVTVASGAAGQGGQAGNASAGGQAGQAGTSGGMAGAGGMAAGSAGGENPGGASSGGQAGGGGVGGEAGSSGQSGPGAGIDGEGGGCQTAGGAGGSGVVGALVGWLLVGLGLGRRRGR